MSETPTSRLIEEKLQILAPVSVELSDESGQHVGHAGAASGGGHYRLVIVSPAFAGKSRIERHRLVYQALGNLMQVRVHALAILAYAPDEL